MGNSKKVTLYIEEDLLNKARKETGEGISETVRQGLRLLVMSGAYQKVRTFRGKYKPSVDLDDLRDD